MYIGNIKMNQPACIAINVNEREYRIVSFVLAVLRKFA